MTMSAAEQFIRAHLATGADLRHRTAERCAGAIAQAAGRLCDGFRAGHTVFFCGNGGSAADCQHLAAEFVSALHHERPRRALPALALTTDTSFLTANANDFGFEQVFARQLEALARPGDLLVAISTSGNSPNVLRALEQARRQQVVTLLLTGANGGAGVALADLAIRVPGDAVQQIQEVHIAIGHMLCELVERTLFPAPGA